MKIALFSLVSLFATSGLLPAAGTIALSEQGRSSYVIVVPEDVIPAEQTAAEQLQKYLKEITGAELKIKSEKVVSDSTPQILVGAGERVKKLLPQQNWDALGRDGIVIKTEGRNLILAGGRPRGTLYSVFRFLQNTVGCRWWTPTEAFIPEIATLRIPDQNTVYRPPFDYRSQQMTATIDDPVFATIMGENGTVQKQTKEWGGHNKIFGSVHTMLYLVPPEKYFAEHPEWFTDSSKGSKPSTESSPTPNLYTSQLCWTNPGVVEALTENALEWISRDPDCGYISISQGDNDYYCTCEKCEELFEKEGSHSGALLNVVNQVAEKVKEKYPDFIVETLAYRKTVTTPKNIKPADNVMIRLAPLNLDFSRPYDHERNSSADPDSTEHIRELLPAWAKLSKQMFIWNYTTNYRYTMLPHPNWDGLGKDLRYFVANNVKGVFLEGDKYTNGVGDFTQLRTWLLAQLLWDPSQDQSKLTNEFLTGYYGAAAPFLRQYLDLLVKKFVEYPKLRLTAYNENFFFMDLAAMNEATKLFDKAKDAVKQDPVLSERVRLQRVALDLLWIYQYGPLKQYSILSKEPFLGPVDPVAAVAAVDETARHFNIKQFHQQHSDDIGLWSEELERLQQMSEKRPPLPPEVAKLVRKGREEVDVIDLDSLKIQAFKEKITTTRVADPLSTSGRAIRHADNNLGWVITYQMANYAPLLKNDEWHMFVSVRADIDEKQPLPGDAIQTGVYDMEMWKKTKTGAVFSKNIPVSELADGKYHLIDMGTARIPSTSWFFLAAMGHPAVTAAYIDRLIFVRK